MKTKLFDYQQKIVNDIFTKQDFSVGLFMKMGTGKTITSLSIFDRLKECNAVDKLLVVCLKCKIQDWKDEITSQWDWPPQHEVINFESVWRAKKGDYYKSFVDDRTMIIIDESHKIKSRTSKVSKYLLELSTQTKYKLILTGTPQSQMYIDYYPQMKFINAKDFDIPFSQWDKTFVIKELDSFNGRYFYTIKDYNYKDVLEKGITDKSYYHDYLSKYDKPIDIYTDIPHTKEAIKFQKDRVWRDPDTVRCEDVIADTPGAFRAYLRQSCSGFIKDYTIPCEKEAWLQDFLEIENSRIVIFVNFIKEVNRIRALVLKTGRPCGVYYGAEKDLKPFKDNDNGVIIVNYASGATGINDLCISNIGIFYSPPDGDHILMEQAKSRLDRIGQTKQPYFYYLQTVGSLEKEIYKSLKNGVDFDNKMFELWLNSQHK